MSSIQPKVSRPVPVILTTVTLFIINLIINFSVLSAVNTSGILTGEEASVSFRDSALLPARLQHNSQATNFGGHVYYYIASYLITPLDLFFGRTASAVGMATIAPLMFLVALSALALSLPVSIGLGLLAALAPGILNYSWMATEYGLACPFALLAVLLAARPGKATAVAAAVLAGFAPLVFAPGLCFLPIVYYLIYKRHLRSPSKPWVLLAVLPFLTALVIVFPAIWWTNSNQILTGGGSLSSPAKAWENLLQMLSECALRGGSYYYPSSYAALSSPVLWGSALLGMGVSIWKRKGLWLWLGLFGAVTLYVASGEMIGMRRGVPIIIFSILFAGLFWHVLFATRGWIRRGVALSIILACLIWAGVQANSMRAQYSAGTLTMRLDFRFGMIKGKTMSQMCDLLLKHPDFLVKNQHVFEPDRAYAILHMLATRNGEESRQVYTRERLWREVEARRAAKEAASQAAGNG